MGQMWGSGRCAREICYYMALSVDADYDRDMALLHFYYDKLTGAPGSRVSVSDFTFDQLFHEWAIAFLEWVCKIVVDFSSPFINKGVIDKLLKNKKQAELVRGALFGFDRMLERVKYLHVRHRDQFFPKTHPKAEEVPATELQEVVQTT